MSKFQILHYVTRFYMLETCVIDMATLYPILVSHVYLTRHNLHAECFLCIQWTLVEDSLNLAPMAESPFFE